MARPEQVKTMADLTADITTAERERIDQIKQELISAEREYALASLRKAQGLPRLLNTPPPGAP